MPRRIPYLHLNLARKMESSVGLIRRIEVARAKANHLDPDRIRLHDVELAYELAYLRIFVEWEVFLEEALSRFMCGFQHSGGMEPLKAGFGYAKRIGDAKNILLNNKDYILWHNPDRVIQHAKRILDGSRFELIVASAKVSLENFAAIRHRVAHSQEDAAMKFDRATMVIAGRRYIASRPGRFLRDWNPSTAHPQRWLSTIKDDLLSLATQICQ